MTGRAALIAVNCRGAFLSSPVKIQVRPDSTLASPH